MVPAMFLRSGLTIANRFSLDRMIGAGGFGDVWRARDSQLGQHVAIKVLRPLSDTDRDSRLRFAEEARVLGRLHHANIPRLIMSGETNGTNYIACEYVDGWPLSRLLAVAASKRRILSAADVVLILKGIGSAIQHAHDNGVVHRDLKPDNIMIRKMFPRRISVLDFGAAKTNYRTTLPEGTTVGRVLGTINYCSPEQIKGGEIKPQTDIYGLGVLIFELLTSRCVWLRDRSGEAMPLHEAPLHRASNQAPTVISRILGESPPWVSKYRKSIPGNLDYAVRAAFAREPENRPSTVDKFLGSIEPGLEILDKRENIQELFSLSTLNIDDVESALQELDSSQRVDNAEFLSGGSAGSNNETHKEREHATVRVASTANIGVAGDQSLLSNKPVTQILNADARTADIIAAPHREPVEYPRSTRHPDGRSSRRIAVAVTPEEHSAWKRAASELRVSLSDLVRQSVDYYLAARATTHSSVGQLSKPLTAHAPPTSPEGLTKIFNLSEAAPLEGATVEYQRSEEDESSGM